MLHLIPGNPRNPPGKKPASSTRFVLPFAYRLGPLADHAAVDLDAPVFAELANADNPNLKRRKQYLTKETAKVLFERAHWFVLNKLPDGLAKLALVLQDGRSVEAALNPPLVILFECPNQPCSDHDVLRTGFLVLELYFPGDATPRFDDLLDINELFRYWREPFHGHRQERTGASPGSGYQRLLQNWPLSSGGKIKDASAKDEIYTRRWTGLLAHLLKPHTGPCLKLLVDDISDCPVHADDRTYVWTCALIEGGGEALRDAFKPGADLDATDYGHWIKLLNVDPPGGSPENTHYARRFEQEWAKPLTYRRWEECGTFYGFTPHSGAMLSADVAEPPLWQHFGQMYFDQILLLLYVRTALFRFSERLADISAKARDTQEKTKGEAWLDDFDKLREDFVWFTNLYQFPLLSNQQQAVEMYGLARQAMDINELFAEVEKEIHGSHEYLSLQNQRRQTEMSTLLTVVATMGAVAALAGTYLGLSWLKADGWIATTGVFAASVVYILLFVWLAKPVSSGLEKLYKAGRWSKPNRQ